MTTTQNVRAELRYLHITPRKVRAVAELVRGLTANAAEAQLILSSRRPATALLKLLRSAVQNANHNFKLESSKLYVKEIRVDQGPKLKRFMARARGSAGRIEKKMSHVTLILGVSDKVRPPQFTIPKPDKKSKRKEEHREASKKKTDETAKLTGAKTSHRLGAQEKKSGETQSTKRGAFQKMFRRKAI
ncbi:50S ribosomal protein L22 [Candidatus Jorgensenbacteria bacterium]|nr:50S ribosomal protein L22 [Candidatus Jorgensenbacteria bacterium]